MRTRAGMESHFMQGRCGGQSAGGGPDPQARGQLSSRRCAALLFLGVLLLAALLPGEQRKKFRLKEVNSSPDRMFKIVNMATLASSGKGNHQFEEVDEFVGVFSRGEVHKVPGDSVTQAGAGLNRHFAGGVAKRRAFLRGNTT